jgi:hypothetical protein
VKPKKSCSLKKSGCILTGNIFVIFNIKGAYPNGHRDIFPYLQDETMAAGFLNHLILWNMVFVIFQ